MTIAKHLFSFRIKEGNKKTAFFRFLISLFYGESFFSFSRNYRRSSLFLSFVFAMSIDDCLYCGPNSPPKLLSAKIDQNKINQNGRWRLFLNDRVDRKIKFAEDDYWYSLIVILVYDYDLSLFYSFITIPIYLIFSFVFSVYSHLFQSSCINSWRSWVND